MTNAEKFLKNGIDDIDYFIDKWIDSDMSLLDFLKADYTERWKDDD